MGLREDLPELVKEMNCSRNMARMEHNAVLLDIHEGNLEGYVLKAMKSELSPLAFESAKSRVASINILKKLIEKLSQIYEVPPVRTTKLPDGKEAGESDIKLVQWYEEKFELNQTGVAANQDFNLYKTFAYEPFIDRNEPRLRVIPSDRFFPYSNDKANPLRMTHFVKVMGKVMCSEKKTERLLHYAYTDTEILPFYCENGEPEIASEIMAANGMDGNNPYKKIPFVYVARSRVDLVPQIDTDTLSMTILFPILFTDLNYAIKFQSFSVMYTIDATISGARAPNSVIELKSNPATQNKPEIGTIKPQVDIDQVNAHIRSLLSIWMETRNIKPGAMGSANISNVASGVAKMIDEMDTSADRKKQVPYLQNAEAQLFDLVLNYMHPVWLSSIQNFEMRVSPSKGVKVHSQFSEQRPIVDPSQAIADQSIKVEKGLTSRRRAIKELNPDWDDEQVDELLAEIALEKSVAVQEAQAAMGAEAPGQEADGEQESEEPAEAFGKKTEAAAPAYQ